MASVSPAAVPEHNIHSNDAQSDSSRPTTSLLSLPHELISTIISHLPPHNVARLGATCRKLHSAAVDDDAHWRHRFLSLGLPHPGDSPLPFPSWQALFLAHHPYWFIPQRRLWYADGTELDGGLCGKFLVARYHPHTGAIEAYALAGERGRAGIQAWTQYPSVNIHDFHPKVRLHLAQPVIRLRGIDRRKSDEDEGAGDSNGPDFRGPGSVIGAEAVRGLKSMREAGNDLNLAHHVFAQVMLASAIPPDRQHYSMRLWPPDRLPAIERVRRQSPSVFGGASSRWSGSLDTVARATSFDRPTRHDDVCQNAFRYQRQIGGRVAALYQMLNNGIEGMFGLAASAGSSNRRDVTAQKPTGHTMSSGVATYATLPEDAYRPTPEKPYQGVWVGDYAGHGCEFLLIRQRVSKEEIAASEDFGPKVLSSVANYTGQTFDDEEVEDEADAVVPSSDNDDAMAVDHGPNEGDDDASASDDENDETWSDSSGSVSDEQNGPVVGINGNEQTAPASSSQAAPQQSTNAAAPETSKPVRRHRKRRRFYSVSEGLREAHSGETGRLEAIKLTGDPNVPRGEFTFVAEDIGEKPGQELLRTEPFEGKRAVPCWGHIAAHGFTDDVFVKTDLILVSHDCLAQHWHEFGHVAFYRRVDVDQFFDPLNGVSELQL